MLRFVTFTWFVISIVFPFVTLNGQVLGIITDKFRNYCNNVPREEIYVHTDRNEYIAGEELWFSTYLFTRKDNRPVSGSSIIYIEVLNPENHPVGQKRVLSTMGFGSGEIVLPDTLATGCYTLRAYTGRMRNLMPLNCFIRKVNIYNALNITSTFTCRKEESQTSGQVSTKSTTFGFSVENRTGNDLELKISSSNIYRSQNTNLCYIFIETRGTVNYKAAVNLPDAEIKYPVPLSYLTSGVNHITFFDTKGAPLAERFIYTGGRRVYHPLISAPDSCNRRQDLSVEFDLSGAEPFGRDSSSLSISVAPEGSDIYDEISDYLVFGSEFGMLPGNIAGRDPDKLTPDVIEKFLGNTRSNWIDWNRILSGNGGEKEDLAGTNTHYLSGRLLEKNTHKPVPGKLLFLSSPGKVATFQYSVTDMKGIFIFVLPVSRTQQEYVIQPEENNSNYSVEIISSFSDSYPKEGYTQTFRENGIPEHIQKLSTSYQVNRIYGISFSNPPASSVDTLPPKKRFYGKPDQELVMDDYIKLPVMQEVFYELIPGVSLRNRRNTFEFSIIDPVDNRVQKKPPVLFIDGVMIDDASSIANLDPETVEKIDVIREKYFVGDYIFYGIINVITRAGDFSLVALPDKALRLRYQVVDPESEFRELSDAYKSMINIPDFRNTLYWNPSVSRGIDGKYRVTFRASDLRGDYIINVQGLTSDGKALSATKTFRVN